jgi:alkaline phosphatase D
VYLLTPARTAASDARPARAARWCALLLFASLPATAKLVVMHGYADYTSAVVWIQAEAPGPVEVTWRAGEADLRLTLDAAAANDRVVVARLTGLSPGASVAYRITGDGDRREGKVRTQAWAVKPAERSEFVLAIGSCYFLHDGNPVWPDRGYGAGFEIFDAIAAKSPDAMLWLGDNLYYQRPDFLDPAAMAMRNQRQRSFAPLQNLLTSTAHLAIWDDHDYGPNDADASYVMKGETLKLFQRYWPNPSFGLPDAPGNFGMVHFGDIDVFLLDDRWYRSANRAPDGPGKSMFGARQLEWLRNALLHSTALVKLIAGGNQFINRANRFEGWNRFATEQQAFLEWLAAQKIDGVIFLSGDRHFTELLRVPRPGTYPLHEFTSSPLTSGPFDPPPKGERENPDLVPGTLVAKRQFGLIRIAGPAAARMLTLENYDSVGALQWRQEIPVATLRTPRRGRD